MKASKLADAKVLRRADRMVDWMAVRSVVSAVTLVVLMVLR